MQSLLGDGSTTARVAGAIGTFGYLWVAGQRQPPDKKPLPYFYALAVIAFLCWAVGTSTSVADLVNVGSIGAGVILGLAVFLVPLLDQFSIEFEKWRRARIAARNFTQLNFGRRGAKTLQMAISSAGRATLSRLVLVR